jgi:hypothetical protein
VSAALWAEKRGERQLAERALARLGPSSTGKGDQVPFPFADRKIIKDRHTDAEINAGIKRAPVVDVRLDGLRAIQHSVKPSRVEQYIGNPSLRPPGDLHTRAGTPTDFPVVIRQDGVEYTWDGHHRCTAAKLSGAKTVKARLVDFDAAASSSG